MKGFGDYLAANEDWLLERILVYAKRLGYTKYTSTLQEAWRLSIAGLSESLRQLLDRDELAWELGPDEDFTNDPAAGFGVTEARLHRQRGVSLPMFMGLMKYYLQTYRDLIVESPFGEEDKQRYLKVVERFFDRMEIGFCTEWASLAEKEIIGELQAANRRMTNEKNKYLTIFESIPTPVVILDQDGRVDNFNPEAAELLGQRPLPGSRYYHLTATGDSPGAYSIAALMPWLKEELARLESFPRDDVNLEKTLETPGGQKTYAVRLSPLRDVSGKFTGSVVALSDITQLRNAQRAMEAAHGQLEQRVNDRTAELTASNQRLKNEIDIRVEAQAALMKSQETLRRQTEFLNNSIDALTHPFLVIDARNHKVLLANAASYPRESSVGDTCHYISHGLDRPCAAEGHPCPLQVVRQTKKPVCMEHMHFNDAGEKRVVEVHAYPLLDSQGEVAKVIKYSLDVTERMEAQTALLASQERHRRFLEASPDPIVVYDTEGRVIYVNPAFVETFGWSEPELLGRGIDYVPDDCQAETKAAIERMISEEKVPALRTRRLTKDGRTLEVALSSAVLHDSQGEPAGNIVIIRDITSTAMLEDQLRQSQKMEAMGTLAGGIAHDFNNILGAIIGYTELVRQDASLPESSRKMLDQVLKASGRAKDLINQIFSFSRPAAQDRRPIKVGDILEEALKLLRPSVPSSVEINCRLDSDHDVIIGDATLIHQVIVNLCTNAAHAMHDIGGEMSVTLDSVEVDDQMIAQNAELTAETYLRLTVRDTGHGMSPEVKERVFEPFFSTKKRGEGSGMGLAVVHGIVKNLGGVITVESRPGQGCQFQVYFPMAPREPAEKDARPLSEEPLPTGSGRVMVVDDEESLVDLMQKMLSDLGYQVLPYTSSLEAMSEFKSRPQDIDLVITDLTMPKLGGVDLARQMLGIRRDLPIILCSGHGQGISQEQARVLGIKSMLRKPLMLRQVAEAVRAALAG